MKKITFGMPEKYVPSLFCEKFHYVESSVAYPVDRITFRQTDAGCVIEFPIEDDCQVYGFGLQLKQFNHRGRKLRLAVNADPATNNGETHAPVPFFVTNKGYGMYFDTARYAEFYCGYQKKNGAGNVADGGAADKLEDLYAVRSETCTYMSVRIPAAKGIDIYLFEGATITDIVAQYNMLAGGGCTAPEWGLRMRYRAYHKWDSEKIMEVASSFKKDGIECGSIGLEPGWHSHAYSCSYKWSKLYPNPEEFITKIKEMGYHVNLWGHAFTHPDAEFHDDIAPYSGDYLVWGGLVPDFATKEARDIFANYIADKFVKQGVDGFKLDECDSSDNTGSWSFPLHSAFPSGLDGEQYHSLFGTLYAKTILDALGETATMSEVRQLGALAASYPFVLYSDLYDHKDFIRALVNSGFSGILWSPEFREAHSKEECIRRMQCIVFSVTCEVNAWNYDGIPWKTHECEEELKALLREREKLIPMLKAAFNKYHETGVPPIRALVMDYTGDRETWNVDDEYMFCEDLLVAPIAAGCGNERDVYLPVEEEWEDYFTGELVGNGWIHVDTEGIPVYRRKR